MSPLVQPTILKKFLIFVSSALVFWAFTVCLPTLALAQHAAVRTGEGAVHTSAPPISHVPISSPPVVHAPIAAPRTSRATSADTLGRSFRPPRRPIRPFPAGLLVYEPPFPFGGPLWGLDFCWWATCDLFWPWTLGYTTVSSPGPTNYVSQVYETPVYVYGEQRPDLPQLFLKDGTILNVTDYWLVDDQLHFAMIEENGAKPVEHAIPFEALDLQTTVDANTRRGFRFMLRDEPFEQYLRDHPESPPPMVMPPRE
jgi:hypothetical protein